MSNLIWVCAECSREDLTIEEIAYGHDCEVTSNCEMCESNPKENAEGRWCTSCKDAFKESDND